MAAVTGIKYDDGLPAISANCFPVRTLIRHNVEEEADGAWLVAQRAEQRRRFKAILCTKPKTYARIKEERRRAEKQGTSLTEQLHVADEQEDEEEKDVPTLDGFFLMRHCCVEDPTDLCSVNIAGKEMTDVKEEDLALFDNVAYVNASENFLPFEAFRGFPILRELEMPLNGLRSIKPNFGDYPFLEVLDLSYNNLSQDDILTLGLVPNIKVLHLTGNGLHSLPPNMAMPKYDDSNKQEILRFSKLEILLLDDNRLEDVSVFAALAGLSSLKHLNLEKNDIYYVPMLKSVEGKVVPNDDEKDAKKLRRSAEKGGRRSARGMRSKDVTPRVAPNKIVKENTTDVPQSTPVPTEISEQKGPEKNGDPVQPDPLTEDLTMLSKDLTDLELEKEVTFNTVDEERQGGQLGDGSQLPPFPDLRALNLAYNKIEDEEALLSVAAWPMLVELIIHDNPLTTENSGDPPLLQRFLGDRLGIRIKRKKEAEIVKPPVEVKMRRSRHVNSVVPKIPKIPVDQLLMLEAPKPPTEPKPEKSRTSATIDHQKPLPPIPGTPTEGQRSRSRVKNEGQRSEAQTEMREGDKVQTEEKGQGKQDGDAFFMTQVDDQEAEKADKTEALQPTRRRKKKVEDSNQSNKYKGYEILLDCDEDGSYIPPKDMHGNIKALKYALGHELVYRDPAACLDRISKPVEPYRKAEMKSSPRVTQGDRKAQMLREMCERVTTEEAPLDEVLEGENRGLHKKFPEADRLLSEIQRRYNTVRVNSMKEAREAKKMLNSTMDKVSRTKSGKHVKLEV
ncbi:X-ray radiation resistance-associated protein 1-like isoform X2 [Mya arenaria]|uniref:X-ray radiation resistance-associated protein 1-like isoform X2 n=1 Tax=Mya arenaria TaxID=6604 RepID=UPI0022E2100F|nr:X-ray radiation resistance-associated protein 1-like isoform X2 [Mya arenaria]